jgi:hypothetical protein
VETAAPPAPAAPPLIVVVDAAEPPQSSTRGLQRVSAVELHAAKEKAHSMPREHLARASHENLGQTF